MEPPQLQEAARVITEALARRKLVVMLATCSVEYRGRAASKLGEGDRLIVIKPDGCVLVHRPYGSQPVNYQPEGSIVRVREAGGRLLIVASRSRPREELVIEVTRLIHVAAAEMRDSAELEMWGSERDVRDAIAANPAEFLGEKLVPVDAEVKLSRGSYADLLMVDERGNFVVVEVKREEAGVEAVYQLKRYVEHVRRALGPNVRGVLVAPSITKRALAVLSKEGFEFRQIDLKQVVKAKQGGLTEFLEGGERRDGAGV